MKRFGLSLLAMMLVMIAAFGIGAASASELPLDLPQSVKTLIEQTYPDYEMVMISGSGDDEQGAFVILLFDRGEPSDQYIATVLEKSEGDATYAQSGASLPMYNAPLAVAFEGSELVITCSNSMGERDTKDYFFAKSAEGAWTLTKGALSAIPFAYGDRAGLEIMNGYQLLVHTDFLEYARFEDGLQSSYPQLLYGEGFKPSLTLEQFAGDFPLSPWHFNNSSWNSSIDTPFVEEGETLTEFVLLREDVVLIVELADGMRQVKIYPWDHEKQAFGEPQKTKPTAVKLFLDEIHAGDDELQFRMGDAIYNFERTTDGKWYLSWFQNIDNVFVKLSVNYAHDYSDSSIVQSERVHRFYGTHPFADILLMDLGNMPSTADEIMSQLDTSHYAYVNNPNSDDRLNIRTEPKSDAATIGKLYNRTPLYVKEILGDWVHIGVGNAEGLEGYVMKKFLAMGEGKEQVQATFPQLMLTEEGENQPLYAEPSEKSEILTFAGSMNYDIVGVYGDDWLIIMMDDGTVGYAQQDHYWPGNG